MAQLTNTKIFRTLMVLLHGLANFMVISFFLKYDLTKSWLIFILFIAGCILLTAFFAKHLISFIRYLQSN